MRKHLNFMTISTAAITAGALIAACSNAPATPDSATRQADSPATDQATEALTVLFVADLHAQLYEHPELFWHEGEDDRLEMAGGFARVAAAIDAIKAERPGRVLVLDGGDTLQGAGEAALTQGAAIVPALNALGIDAAIPGNWEVAYGPEVLKQRATELNFPLFAANLRDEATGERLFPPYIVREFGEVKIGVLGYTDPDVPERQPPAYSWMPTTRCAATCKSTPTPHANSKRGWWPKIARRSSAASTKRGTTTPHTARAALRATSCPPHQRRTPRPDARGSGGSAL